MIFNITQLGIDATLIGFLTALSDRGPSNSPAYIILKAGPTALVTLTLANPPATLVSHELVFHQNDVAGDLIPTQGNADNFELYNGAGALLGSGDVTDMTGTGSLKISGTTGTLLYAGAQAILGSLKMN